MEKFSTVKTIEKGYMPEFAVVVTPGHYEKNRMLKEADLLAAYDMKPEVDPETPEPTPGGGEEMNQPVVPSAIWTAGLLYATYFTGERMHLLDVADILVTRWAQGKLAAEDERTVAALDRLMKKRERRISTEERELLYRRVFNFDRHMPDSYIVTNEAFQTDWNQLMKGVAAYSQATGDAQDQAARAARTKVFDATYHLQVHLTDAMTGTAYLMAAEVFTLLRESIDLLHNEEIIRNFGRPGSGMNSVVEHIAAEEFNEMVQAELLTTVADAGSRILQEWVAKFQRHAAPESLPQTLLGSAQAWRMANSRLSRL